jgi:hypothetical protein
MKERKMIYKIINAQEEGYYVDGLSDRKIFISKQLIKELSEEVRRDNFLKRTELEGEPDFRNSEWMGL